MFLGRYASRWLVSAPHVDNPHFPIPTAMLGNCQPLACVPCLTSSVNPCQSQITDLAESMCFASWLPQPDTLIPRKETETMSMQVCWLQATGGNVPVPTGKIREDPDGFPKTFCQRVGGGKVIIAHSSCANAWQTSMESNELCCLELSGNPNKAQLGITTYERQVLHPASHCH